MIQKIINRLLSRRHFWRYATFSEVAEIYASRTTRIFALRLVATFTSIYLLQLGYSLIFIALFFACFYLLKVLFAYPSARIIAATGPKHATFISNILIAISMIFLPLVPEYGLVALTIWGVLQGASTCLYDFAYMVDFSKVKSLEHAGKEIAYMNILEKIAASVGPIVGGFLAFLAGPEVVMIVAVVLFLLAALPLFRTAEPVRIHQRLEFRGFPWRSTWRSLVAETAVGFDVFVTGTAWTIFMAVVIFSTNTDRIYAEVGVVTSISIVAALLASYAFGRIIDGQRGRELLRYSTVLNSFTHGLRIFATTPLSVVMINIINEGATTGYAMAFNRGIFDTADTTGRRIVYLFFVEVAVNLGMTGAALLFALIVWMIPENLIALQLFFAISAAVTLLIASPRFALYRK